MITLITDDRLLFSSFLPTIDVDLLDQRFSQREGWAKQSRRPENSWSLNKWEPLYKCCCLYIKNLLRPLVSKINTIHNQERLFYNTYQAIYSDILLISKIRWVSVRLHATPLCLVVSFLRTWYRRIRMIYDLCSLFSTVLISPPFYPVFGGRQVGAFESSSSTSVGTMLPCVSSLAFMVERVIRLL